MRVGSLILVSLASLALASCRPEPNPPEVEVDRVEAEPADPEPSDSPPSEPAPEPEPERSADHADRVADLDALCRALDHDYVDGTLSDYYAKVEPRTAWGRDQLGKGEDSITPGRRLQAAATDLAVDLDAPELAGCRKLFDEIDELE